MKKIIVSLLALMLLAASCGTTNTVPITGRKTHLLVYKILDTLVREREKARTMYSCTSVTGSL